MLYEKIKIWLSKVTPLSVKPLYFFVAIFVSLLVKSVIGHEPGAGSLEHMVETFEKKRESTLDDFYRLTTIKKTNSANASSFEERYLENNIARKQRVKREPFFEGGTNSRFSNSRRLPTNFSSLQRSWQNATFSPSSDANNNFTFTSGNWEAPEFQFPDLRTDSENYFNFSGLILPDPYQNFNYTDYPDDPEGSVLNGSQLSNYFGEEGSVANRGLPPNRNGNPPDTNITAVAPVYDWTTDDFPFLSEGEIDSRLPEARRSTTEQDRIFSSQNPLEFTTLYSSITSDVTISKLKTSDLMTTTMMTTQHEVQSETYEVNTVSQSGNVTTTSEIIFSTASHMPTTSQQNRGYLLYIYIFVPVAFALILATIVGLVWCKKCKRNRVGDIESQPETNGNSPTQSRAPASGSSETSLDAAHKHQPAVEGWNGQIDLKKAEEE
ncbi:uncharacterized protein LOC143469127 isoform X1 [Clavelina lepadiformis]|uniref:uncharacterized protein LOC143469127 isoform X1 n=1 Tax=Clavelina lepadiformis TaxID=159417 RepID=UPI0040419A3B